MPFGTWLRSVAVLTLLSLACACGGGGGGGTPNPPNPPAPQYDWYVSETTGSDGAAGTEASPFRTISYACTQATSGQTIKVLPGTYSTAIGEVFPIVIPPGVIVLGDEVNKGAGTTFTTISGGGLVPAPNVNASAYAAVVPGTGSTVAGFRIVNDPAPPTLDEAVHMQAANVTLRNNRLVDSQYGILFKSGFGNQIVIGNVIQNTVIGIGFAENSGIGCRLENNVITLNNLGVDYDAPGGDLGGGAAASTGGNVISCNAEDLWTNTAMITIDAANNFWDHAPPVGNDIINLNGATIITTGATVAPGACP